MGAADLTIGESRFPARDRLNSRMVKEISATGPVSYPLGGIRGLALALSLSEIYGAYGTLSGDDGFGSLIPVHVAWDYPSQRLLCFYAGSEMTDGGNLSGFTGTLLFTGKG